MIYDKNFQIVTVLLQHNTREKTLDPPHSIQQKLSGQPRSPSSAGSNEAYQNPRPGWYQRRPSRKPVFLSLSITRLLSSPLLTSHSVSGDQVETYTSTFIRKKASLLLLTRRRWPSKQSRLLPSPIGNKVTTTAVSVETTLGAEPPTQQ